MSFKHLLCNRHCAKNFTWIVTFNPYIIPLLFPFSDKETESMRSQKLVHGQRANWALELKHKPQAFGTSAQN